MLHKGFLVTEDRINIAYEHKGEGKKPLIVICPGFFNSMANRWMKQTVDIIGKEYDTLIFDFRGHGSSSGRFSWTSKERLDLESVISYAGNAGYKMIGLLGFSLGAAVAVITVSQMGHDKIKSMVLISPPIGFWQINYHFWEPEMFGDIKDNFECNWEGKGARTGNILLRKQKPISRIKHIKDLPIMFMHGTKDWIIKDYHSRMLYEAYPVLPEKKKLVLIKDGLHAERLIQAKREETEPLIMGWFGKTLNQPNM